MNCKQGDLAVVISARKDPRWVGKIVRVVREFPGLNAWITDPMPSRYACVGDEILRPIRDSEDPDETITWAGKPNETPVEIIQRETA